MRFDFSGIGNSGGVFDNTTVNQWTDDLGEAVRELSIRSGLERVSIVGLRWGAVFAYYYALRNPIHRLILWDPVTVGQSCLTQYRHMNDCVRGYGYPVQDNSTGEDLLGFNYSDRLIADLSRVNLLDSAPPPCATIGFCLTEQSLQSNNLMMQWKSRQSRLSVRIGREDAGWNDPANYDNAILLNEARRSVLEMMQESMT